MLCQSVCSFHSPVCWSFWRQLVAMENVATDVPLGVNFDSASLPSRPTRITLFTLRDAILPQCSTTRFPFGAGFKSAIHADKPCDGEPTQDSQLVDSPGHAWTGPGNRPNCRRAWSPIGD